VTTRPDAVHWHLRLLADVPGHHDWLSPDEHEVLRGLHVPKRRNDWRLGRFTAKELLSAYFGVAMARVGVRAADDGAPEALVDGQPAGVSLSISHREGHGLAVVGPPGTTVGADLEWVEPRTEAFVRDWLSPAEQDVAAHSVDRNRAVALLWSAKEAVTKLWREGLRIDPRQLEVELGREAPAAGWRHFTVAAPTGRAAGWWRVDGALVTTVATNPAADPPHLVFD
jgi:4'-phosphopantetheinyl transferase